MPVVFYGCEAWSLTLMEESGLRIFEIMLLRSICGRKRNEVRRERGIVDNEELNYLYSLHNFVWCPNREVRNGQGMKHVLGEERCIQGFSGDT